MKLIITIINDSDNEPVSQALIAKEFRVTRIASTGGFFRKGSSTLVIGVRDERVEAAIEIIRDNTTPQTDSEIDQATIFVIPVENYIQI
jgi:uncharacterized protein YaaQ